MKKILILAVFILLLAVSNPAAVSGNPSTSWQVFVPLVIAPTYTEPEFPDTVGEFLDLVATPCRGGEFDCLPLSNLEVETIIDPYGGVVGFRALRNINAGQPYFRMSNPWLDMKFGFLHSSGAREQCGISQAEIDQFGLDPGVIGAGLPGRMQAFAVEGFEIYKDMSSTFMSQLQNQTVWDRCPGYQE